MKPVAQSASKESSIVKTLNQYRETGNFTSFDLQRLKKDAKQVKEIDLSAGFNLIGMIACFEGDIDAMHSYHKRAIQQSGNNPVFMVNYARSLIASNFYKEAYKYAFKAYDLDPLNLDCLGVVIEITCLFNETEKYAKYINKWKEITKKDYFLEYTPLYMIKDFKSYYKFIHKNVEIWKTINIFHPGLIQFFGTPLNIILEVIPEPGYEDELVAWVQWYGDLDDGMERYNAFENWFIDNEYDLKSDVLHFNIEMVGE